MWNRRRVLRNAGAAVLTAATGTLAMPDAEAAEHKPKRVLRLAHLTDIHVQPELRADEGLESCLRHVYAQKDRPGLILGGGDCVMDSFGQDAARTKTQWDVWDGVWKGFDAVPARHAIGNHDVWGWNKKSSRATGDEPLYGKRQAMDRLDLVERYYSFDRAGWRFIVLDSTFPQGDAGYTARLDDAQFAWLTALLADTPATMHVLVLSHIPILCACAFLDGENEKSGDWVVPGSWMHIDARRIKDLFFRHPNVRLALSGHIHLRDRLDYNGVTYLCNGAVCGSWWRGSYHETPPGYALVDLFEDGTFANEYVVYDGAPNRV